MHAQRKDANEGEIILGLTAAGCCCIQMDRTAGFDLVVVRDDKIWLFEDKMKGGKLTKNEIKTMARVKEAGGTVHLVYSLEQALEIIGTR